MFSYAHTSRVCSIKGVNIMHSDRMPAVLRPVAVIVAIVLLAGAFAPLAHMAATVMG